MVFVKYTWLLIHSFKNFTEGRIYPLKGFIVSTHILSCPAPSCPPLVQTHAPTPLKTPPSSHRLYDLQDTLDKLMRFLPHCQTLFPSKTGFIISAHRLTNITMLNLIATLQFQGESPTYILNEDTQPEIRAIEISHTACKDEIRQNLRSHSWSVALFL